MCVKMGGQAQSWFWGTVAHHRRAYVAAVIALSLILFVSWLCHAAVPQNSEIKP